MPEECSKGKGWKIKSFQAKADATYIKCDNPSTHRAIDILGRQSSPGDPSPSTGWNMALLSVEHQASAAEKREREGTKNIVCPFGVVNLTFFSKMKLQMEIKVRHFF